MYSQILGIVLTLPLASLIPWTCLGSSDTVVCIGMSPRIPSVWNVFEVAHPVGTLAVEGFGTHFVVCCLLTSCLPGHVSKHFPCSMWALCSALRISRVGFSQETGAFPQASVHWCVAIFSEVPISKLICHTFTYKKTNI